jgi:hypothetical protein
MSQTGPSNETSFVLITEPLISPARRPHKAFRLMQDGTRIPGSFGGNLRRPLDEKISIARLA